ncbi:MAG: hypothetical protein M3362_21580 [Acidobacteriota bacterium]|nr:hypothetical protein [Acidobacteriota bacterium]
MEREETLRGMTAYAGPAGLFAQGDSEPLPPVSPEEPLPPLAPEDDVVSLPPLAPEEEPLPPLAPE